MINSGQNHSINRFSANGAGGGGPNSAISFSLPLADLGAGAVDTTPARSHGSSTPTFTRATAAWTKLSTGLWASVASGTARSCYLGADTTVGAYGGYFAEGAGTQLVTPDASIRDMTDAAWVAGATMTVAKTGTGIDGVVNSCSRLTGGAVSATNTIFQTLTAAASSRTYSVWLKRVTGTGTINITENGGTNYTDVTSQINASTFTRVSLNASILNAAFGLQVVTSGDEILADFNQFEAGAVATSPMASAGAARNADVLTYAAANNVLTAEGSFYYEVAPIVVGNWSTIATNTMALSYEGSNGTPGALVASTLSGILIKDGSNTVNGPAGTPANVMKHAASYSATTSLMQAFANGLAGTAGAFDGSMNVAANFRIGGLLTGTAEANACIKNLRIYNRALSNLAVMTT